ARLVSVVGRRHVGTFVHPAMPGGGDARGFRLAVVDHPAPVAGFRPVIGVAELVRADELARPPGPEAGAERLPVPPGEELQEELLHERSGRDREIRVSGLSSPAPPVQPIRMSWRRTSASPPPFP